MKFLYWSKFTASSAVCVWVERKCPKVCVGVFIHFSWNFSHWQGLWMNDMALLLSSLSLLFSCDLGLYKIKFVAWFYIFLRKINSWNRSHWFAIFDLHPCWIISVFIYCIHTDTTRQLKRAQIVPSLFLFSTWISCRHSKRSFLFPSYHLNKFLVFFFLQFCYAKMFSFLFFINDSIRASFAY